MTNNDILRALRYALDLSDSKLLACFAAGDVELPAQRLMAMLKHEDEPGFEPLTDALFGAFLDGFVNIRRGKRETAGAPVPPSAMSNNRVMRALRIGLELKDSDILDIMGLAGFAMSKAEVNALFRREGHPNFQPCGNQFLRNFLRGLAVRQRGTTDD